MIIKDLCVQPESKLDELFIESEMKFLIEVSIHKQKEFKNKNKYSSTIKQRYIEWLMENYQDGRSETSYNY